MRPVEITKLKYPEYYGLSLIHLQKKLIDIYEARYRIPDKEARIAAIHSEIALMVGR